MSRPNFSCGALNIRVVARERQRLVAVRLHFHAIVHERIFWRGFFDYPLSS